MAGDFSVAGVSFRVDSVSWDAHNCATLRRRDLRVRSCDRKSDACDQMAEGGIL